MISNSLQDYQFDLPQELIAQFPTENRSDSRLFVVRKNPENGLPRYEDLYCKDLPELILSEKKLQNSIWLRNQTKVFPARFYVQRDSGGKHEIVLLEALSQTKWKALIRNQASIKNSQQKLYLQANTEKHVLCPESGLIDFSPCCQTQEDVFSLLDDIGEMPLPPYISNRNRLRDIERYQSVWAKEEHKGSAAAPTASLHFDNDTISKMHRNGASFVDSVLRVGLGTFAPIRDSLEDHKMHSEKIFLPKESLKILQSAEENKTICCLGTTAMRLVESVNLKNPSAPIDNTDLHFDEENNLTGHTNIFIKKGFPIKNTQVLFTNFHLPQSTLLILLSTFIGSSAFALEAYREAVKRKYRFFSYGDASIWL